MNRTEQEIKEGRRNEREKKESEKQEEDIRNKTKIDGRNEQSRVRD